MLKKLMIAILFLLSFFEREANAFCVTIFDKAIQKVETDLELDDEDLIPSENYPLQTNELINDMISLNPPKRGLILGVGLKNDFWHQRHWETLDVKAIQENLADIIMDANNLDGLKDQYDYLFGEHLTFGPKAVHPNELLETSFKNLKKGAYLILKTINTTSIYTTIPNISVFSKMFEKLGFSELTIIKGTLHRYRSQKEKEIVESSKVWYFAKK